MASSHKKDLAQQTLPITDSDETQDSTEVVTFEDGNPTASGDMNLPDSLCGSAVKVVDKNLPNTNYESSSNIVNLPSANDESKRNTNDITVISSESTRNTNNLPAIFGESSRNISYPPGLGDNSIADIFYLPPEKYKNPHVIDNKCPSTIEKLPVTCGDLTANLPGACDASANLPGACDASANLPGACDASANLRGACGDLTTNVPVTSGESLPANSYGSFNNLPYSGLFEILSDLVPSLSDPLKTLSQNFKELDIDPGDVFKKRELPVGKKIKWRPKSDLKIPNSIMEKLLLPEWISYTEDAAPDILNVLFEGHKCRKNCRKPCLFTPGLVTNKLMHYLSIAEGFSLTDYLLCSKGIGRVRFNDEVSEISESILIFMTMLSTELVEEDPNLEFTVDFIGSMKEECRAGYADEYDMRLDFINPPPDLIEILKLHYATKTSGIDSSKIGYFPQIFYKTFETAVLKHLGESIGPLLFADWDVNNSNFLCMIFWWRKDEQGKAIHIKVDCVPSFPLHDTWPSARLTDPLDDPITPVCHFIIPRENQDSSAWPQLSSCAAEQEFMAKVPDYVKDAYVILKLITGGQFQNMFALIKFDKTDHSPLSSYSIKNALFCAVSKELLYSIESNYTNKTTRAIKTARYILAELIQTYFKQKANVYFLPYKYPLNQPNFYIAYLYAVVAILNDLDIQHCTGTVHYSS